MLRLRLLAAIVGALAAGLSVATIAAARSDDAPPAPTREYAFGVGTFGPACWQTHGGPFCSPFDFTLRLLGVGRGRRSGAWGEFERRNNVTGGVFAGSVTCTTIAGHRAALGGFITRTPGQPGIAVGDPWVLYVEDNGTPGSGTADRVSALAAVPEGDPDRPLMPDGFPWVCPAADSIYGYAPLATGDITVAARD